MAIRLRMDKGDTLVEKLGYEPTVEGTRARFGGKLQRLRFSHLVAHALYRREEVLEDYCRNKERLSNDLASILAVRQTMADFFRLRLDTKLRARLILQAAPRSMRMRDPQVEEDFGRMLGESIPWKNVSFDLLASLLLFRVCPDCKRSLIDVRPR